MQFDLKGSVCVVPGQSVVPGDVNLGQGALVQPRENNNLEPYIMRFFHYPEVRDSALWVVEEGVDEVVKGEVDMDAGKSNEKKSFLYDMLSLKVPGNLCYRGA